MTIEEAKKMLPFMRAYAEGKTIQFRAHINDEWEDIKDPVFNGFTGEYRIKPEPKYRPFESLEECWNEMLKHQPFGWLREEDGNYILPATVGNKSDFIFRFKVYEFADGTPFGIKE